MLGQNARSIWRTCKCFLTIETGCMDPTNIIMFLLVFCVTGAIVTTDKQRADGFTKPLESAAFYKWRRHIISAHPPV